MPALHEIQDSVFAETLTRAVQEVFKTMLARTATPIELPADATLRSLDMSRPHVVGTVGFVGTINGLIYLHLDLDFARDCSAQLLGFTPAEMLDVDDETINDAIGELTNMTVGTFKNQLSDRGFPCRLTIPSIVRGSNFSIEPIGSATRRLYRYQIGDYTLTADLIMEPGE